MEECDLGFLVVLSCWENFRFLDALDGLLHHLVRHLVCLEIHFEVVLAEFARYS